MLVQARASRPVGCFWWHLRQEGNIREPRSCMRSTSKARLGLQPCWQSPRSSDQSSADETGSFRPKPLSCGGQGVMGHRGLRKRDDATGASAPEYLAAQQGNLKNGRNRALAHQQRLDANQAGGEKATQSRSGRSALCRRRPSPDRRVH